MDCIRKCLIIRHYGIRVGVNNMKENKVQRAPVLASVGRAIKLTVKSGNAGGIIFTAIWMCVGAVTSYTAVINARFFDAAADMIAGKEDAFNLAIKWLGIWALLEIIIQIISMLNNRISVIMQQKLSYYIENQVMDKIGKIKLKYFDDREAQKKIRFCKHNFGNRVSNVTQCSLSMVRYVITFVTAAVILWRADRFITIIVIICVFPGVVLERIESDKYYELNQWNSFEGQMQSYLSKVISKRKYIKEMRFYQLYDYMEERYEDSVYKMNKQQLKLARTFLVADSITSILNYGSVAVALGIISWKIFHGEALIGAFILVYTTVQNMQSSLTCVFSCINQITDSGRYLEDYETVLSYEEEPLNNEINADKVDKLEVKFEHVYFAYPGTEREVLKDINITIKQGEKIAIVGENGSGKSTFVSLLEGLYEPTRGRILVNGEDIGINMQLLRSCLSCTTQEFLHFEDTVAENICIGDAMKSHTIEDVECALEKSGIKEEMKSLSNGLETVLGVFAPGGIDLSGGQWQKIAMARNLIKKDALMMVMDEPTAALDPLAESKLYHEFQKLTVDKTVLLISHRLGATRIADRVIVFDNGQIKEDGTHEQLLRANGLYATMYQAQSQWYVE